MAKTSFDQQYYALLASRIREHDADAFAELYATTHKMLYRRISYFLHDSNDAQDAMQEVYMSVYKNIGNLKLDRLLIPWMLQITYHICCDFARDSKAKQDFSAELKDGTAAGAKDDPFRQVFDQESWKQVHAILEKRPVKERQAFLLRYENGLTLEEIADFMGVSLASVKRYIAAVRDCLKKDMAHLRP